MTAKLLIAIVLSATLLTFCTGCATRELSTAGLTKEQVQLEHARLVDARQVRSERWARVGEIAGTMAINVAGQWLKTWLTPDDAGFKK